MGLHVHMCTPGMYFSRHAQTRTLAHMHANDAQSMSPEFVSHDLSMSCTQYSQYSRASVTKDIYIHICMHTRTYLTTDVLCMYADGCISKKAICADAHACPHIHMLCVPILCMCLQTCKQVTWPTCLDEDITATYMIHSSFQHRHARRVRSSSCACKNTQTTACSRDTLS